MPLHRPRARSPQPLVLLGQHKPILHEHTPDQHSFLTFPPSPTSLRAVPRTPLIPPSRLHLRTLLSPPLSARFENTAPAVPYPWLWRCHKCGSVYQLGVTRRCLHDGHLFCSVPAQPSITVSCEDEVGTAVHEDEDGDVDTVQAAKQAQLRHLQRKRQTARQKRRKVVECKSEFDYGGWAEYNSWRRHVKFCKFEKAKKTTASSEDEEQMEMEFKASIGRNCWISCEFPSECHHTRMQTEIERKQIAALNEQEEIVLETKTKVEASHHNSSPTSFYAEGKEDSPDRGKTKEIDEWEEELRSQRLAKHKAVEDEMEELETFTTAVYGGSKSLSSSATCSTESPIITALSSPQLTLMSPTNEMCIVDMERHGLEGEAQLIDVGLGPISNSVYGDIDIDLEDEDFNALEFAKRHRKKSIQKIAQLTGLMLGADPVERDHEEVKPTSPLKHGFALEEAEFEDVYFAGIEGANDAKGRV